MKEVIYISQVLKLVSPIPVSVNHYLKPRSFITYIAGKPKAMVTMYETSDAKKYKKNFIKYIQEQARLQGWIKSDNRFQKYYIDCTFYFPRIDMDSNNTYKLMLDSITESTSVWIDDVQACERTQGIYYDSKNPRVELEICPVDFVGIFPTYEHLQKFKSKCITCSKYKEGRCSVFIKANEGRIDEDIQNFECSKFKINKQ